jgi:pentatricopeptide repeat protein
MGGTYRKTRAKFYCVEMMVRYVHVRSLVRAVVQRPSCLSLTHKWPTEPHMHQFVLYVSTHGRPKESAPVMTVSSIEEAKEELFRLTELEHVTNERVLLAWNLLDRLENELDQVQCNEMINRVVDAWQWRTKEKSLALEPHEVLAKVESLGVADIKTYAKIVYAASKYNPKESPKIAESILLNFTPNTVLLNSVLTAYVKSELPEAPYKAENLLQQHEDIAGNGSYYLVLCAWASQRDAARRAEMILERMENAPHLDPDTRAYNAVLQSWVKSGNPPKAEAILNKMQRLHDGGNRNVQPDFISFSRIVFAYSQAHNHNAAERAEAILDRMQDLYDRGNPDMKPSKRLFTAVIAAWANRGDSNAATRAEAILEKMQQLYRAGNAGLKPDKYAFCAVINAWAKCRSPAAAERAEAILNRMQELYEAGNSDAKPNTVIYTCVITAFARSGTLADAERAEALLERMYELYEAGDHDVKPSATSVTSVIAGFARLGNPTAARRAESLLVKMYIWSLLLLSSILSLMRGPRVGTRQRQSRSFSVCFENTIRATEMLCLTGTALHL